MLQAAMKMEALTSRWRFRNQAVLALFVCREALQLESLLEVKSST